ncbi:hypothetical protein [Streptomyces canus]|uniref:hypothetical protein n=1 Tax=Streptomyces canus TaxID=58343 RepID=UPI00277FFCF1|nr:hypothetical protein [Streptomyces canus]MDQ0765671.1 hypothetical protein [Streptomyces canus]
MTSRTGLWLELLWDGQRERTEILEVLDLPGHRALLTIVNTRRPGIRMAWVYWDPDGMRLINEWHRGASATAETEQDEGDAHRIGVGEMSDCFTGDWTTFQPHRDVEVRAGGRWHRGQLLCRYHGPTEDRAVVTVEVLFWEPDWQTMVTYKRMYRWDAQAIRSPDADQPKPI